MVSPSIVDRSPNRATISAQGMLMFVELTWLVFLRVLDDMSPVAFDTLKLAQRLEAAGFPPQQAQDMASAISETIGDTVVTREYFDLRLAELRADIARYLAATKADLLKWMFGTVGFQTLAILGAIAALSRLFG